MGCVSLAGFVWTNFGNICLIPTPILPLFCATLFNRRIPAVKDTQVVNPFLRLYRYAFPHRRKLYLSIVLAWLVAFFWGLNLSMTFLVVKVFLQGQTVGQYIDEEITLAQDEIAKRSNTLKRLDDM